MDETEGHTTTAESDSGDGYLPDDTIPISTVAVGMWKAGGEPVATISSAVCDVCGQWASRLWTAGRKTTADDSLTHVRISRGETVHVYACTEHADQVANALVDEFGAAFGAYEPDDLAAAVSKRQRF